MAETLSGVPFVEEGAEFDIVVLGGGAAGLSAAVFAALEGRQVLLVERTEYLGGTSAFSAGTIWIPNTRHKDSVGGEDSPEKVLGFLDRAVGNRAPRALREAFVANGPAAVDRLEDATDLHLRARPFHPDYLYELEGSTSCGRALESEPFDASVLGRDLALVRPPIPEFTILGGMMIDRDDIPHLLKMGKSLRSLAHSLRLVGSYYVQRLRHGRGTRLVMGNALIARLLLSARKLGVRVVTRTQVTTLEQAGHGYALTIQQGGQVRRVIARYGVILASGGFAKHPTRRAQMLPSPLPDASPSAPGSTGELHDLVLEMGAHYADTYAQPVFWAPVSNRKRPDGSTASFPHFVLDRSKPGMFTVNRHGRRFVNESWSYHDFASTMYARNKDGDTIPAFMIGNADTVRKYGMGMVRPGTRNMQPFLDDGYLTRGDTLADLAAKLEIDAAALAETAERMNGFAKTGVDTDFGRGSTVYQTANGDPTHGPNPTLGPVGAGPYFALRLWPGEIGAANGLVTDDHARVLRRDGTPIAGLYACGADMASIMGGVYPGPGITLGPGIVFGYIAARTACGVEG